MARWGDLNEIVYHSEKSGGRPRSPASIDNFQDAFLNSGLFNMGFSSYEYTWCNYQVNGVLVEEGVDCFCANTNWSMLFPEATITHINFDGSDHLPILLKCAPNGHACADRKRHFFFENMWFTESSCHEVVLSAWESTSAFGEVKSLLFKLDTCSK